MANNTIAFALDGEVPMPVFDRAAHHWTRLVTALTLNITKRNQVLWYMDESPSLGSSQSVRGEAEDPEAVEAVVHGYESVAKAVQTNRQVPYSLRVRQHANGLVNVLTITEKVLALRFVTSDEEIPVFGQDRNVSRKADMLQSYGTIEGQIQTLSSRGRLFFTLYDSVFDRAVSCYLQPGQERMVADKWNAHAIVRGVISRDPTTGHPMMMRSIDAVSVLPLQEYMEPQSARGILNRDGAESLVSVLGRLRDEW